MHLQGYNIIGIMQKLWDSLHNWSAVMEGQRIFRKDSRKERRGVALCVKE